MFPRLETQRLILRPFLPVDAPFFAEYRSDPETARYQGWDTPYSLVQALAFVEEIQQVQPGKPGQWYQVAIQLKHGEHLIGDCAFCVLAEDPRQAEIGFTLARAFRGKGYITEAVTRLLDHLFHDLNLHRVRAICDAENSNSVKVLERLRMRREAYCIENYWFKGRWSSEFWYAILQKEWVAKQNNQHNICDKRRKLT